MALEAPKTPTIYRRDHFEGLRELLVTQLLAIITQTANAPAGPVPAERVFDHYQRRQSPISPPSPCRPPGPEGRAVGTGRVARNITWDAA